MCARALIFTLALVLAVPALARELVGTIVGTTDDDTLRLLVNRQKVVVRQIDATEKAQPFGQRSRQSLADLAFQKTARVVESGRDRYGRTVGTVYVVVGTSTPSRCVGGWPGSSSATSATRPCSSLSRRPGRHTGACGATPTGCRLGSGAGGSASRSWNDVQIKPVLQGYFGPALQLKAIPAHGVIGRRENIAHVNCAVV